MNENSFGKVYFEVLATINDQLANNLAQVCLENRIDQEVIRKILFVSQSTVDSTGGNALPALIKSGK